MLTKKIFLASSSELLEDRKEFEIFISRKNKDWVDKGIFLELVIWEDHLDVLSKTRLQDEYNKAIQACDIFVMLFHTKVGQYTEEEFDTAHEQFKVTNRPFILTYFKAVEITIDSANEDDLASLLAFKKKLKELGHFYTRYANADVLKYHFNQQLDKLAANGFIELKWNKSETDAANSPPYEAMLTGSGAIAQGPGATAIGERGAYVGGNNTGDLNTGTKIDTGGGPYIRGNVKVSNGDFVGRDKISHGISPQELDGLFAPILAAIAQHAPVNVQAQAVQQVQELKAEVAKDTKADDGKMAKLVEGLVGLVPAGVGAVVSAFATPVLGGIAGPVTKFVLDKFRGN